VVLRVPALLNQLLVYRVDAFMRDVRDGVGDEVRGRRDEREGGEEAAEGVESTRWLLGSSAG
jgi:hypothetical protein